MAKDIDSALTPYPCVQPLHAAAEVVPNATWSQFDMLATRSSAVGRSHCAHSGVTLASATTQRAALDGAIGHAYVLSRRCQACDAAQ